MEYGIKIVKMLSKNLIFQCLFVFLKSGPTLFVLSFVCVSILCRLPSVVGHKSALHKFCILYIVLKISLFVLRIVGPFQCENDT